MVLILLKNLLLKKQNQKLLLLNLWLKKLKNPKI